MKVYAYFESLNTIPLNNHTVKMWYDSWSKNGWEPIILGENDARKHQLYNTFSNAIKNFPSVNPPGFDYHAFMRWLAVPAVGGWLSTEPDVINYNLKPCDVSEWIDLAKDDVLQCHSPVPSFLCGSPKSYENVCARIVKLSFIEDLLYVLNYLKEMCGMKKAIDGKYPHVFILELHI